jgi:hypothetical protein
VCCILQNKSLQWYRKEYCGLQFVHSHTCTQANRYQNNQLYVHTNKTKKCAIIRCSKPR